MWICGFWLMNQATTHPSLLIWIWMLCVRAREEIGEGRWRLKKHSRANMPYVFTSHILPGPTRLHSTRLSAGRRGQVCGNLFPCRCTWLVAWPWSSFSFSSQRQVWKEGNKGSGEREREWRLDEYTLCASVSCGSPLIRSCLPGGRGTHNLRTNNMRVKKHKPKPTLFVHLSQLWLNYGFAREA